MYFLKILKHLFASEEGQGLAEYAFIIVLIAIVVVTALLSYSEALIKVYSAVTGSL